MKKYIPILIILVFCILDVTALNYITVFGVKPDLYLIFVIMVSFIFVFELKWALFFSFLSGFFKDILGINTFGINTLLFPLWSFFIIKLSKNILIENDFVYAILVFMVVFIQDIVTRLILLSFGNSIPLIIFIRTAPLESLYSAVLFVLVFRVNQLLLSYKRK